MFTTDGDTRLTMGASEGMGPASVAAGGVAETAVAGEACAEIPMRAADIAAAAILLRKVIARSFKQNSWPADKARPDDFVRPLRR
jgi:hypothetical protein